MLAIDKDIILREYASAAIVEALSSQRLRVVTWGRTDCGPGWSRHQELRRSSDKMIHVVLFPIAGYAWYEVNGKRIDMLPGGIYWVPAFDTKSKFSRCCPEFFSHFYLSFYYEFYSGVELLKDWQTPEQIGEWDVEQQADAWQPETLNVPNAWLISNTVDSALIRHCGSRLTEEVERRISMHGDFSAVFDYMEQNLSANLRIASLMQIAGLSRSAFTRTFIRITGHPPKDHLKQLIFRRAIELLLLTKLSLKEIARDLGFTNEHYFNLFFSKQCGISPGKYRKSNENTSL